MNNFGHFPYKIDSKKRKSLLALTFFNIVLEVLANTIKKEKKRRKTEIRHFKKET